MANECVYPCLPCRDLDESLAFYHALGFATTYRQLRPNPYAVVAREAIAIHLFGIDGFEPANSYGNVIITVPDPAALYHAFAEGLRDLFGKLPATGIPRILRPRKKYGTISGFSVIDPGGNWLRIYPLGQTEQEDAPTKATGLSQIILVAARLGDAHGDDAKALQTLENGMSRYPDASTLEQVQAYLYRAELALRLGKHELARSSLAAATALPLTDQEHESVAADLAHMTELLQQG